MSEMKPTRNLNSRDRAPSVLDRSRRRSAPAGDPASPVTRSPGSCGDSCWRSVFFVTLAIVLLNLIVDVAYVVLDPRVRLAARP
jgi:hypothetical protein